MELFEEHFDQTPQKPIYHYTSQSGLIGIFQNKEIWASKIQYLNDSTEFSYAFDLLRSRLDSNKYSGLNEKLKKGLTEIVSGSENLNIFAASFSEEGDLLSQWRAYCPENGGYNIGFKYSDLKWALQNFEFNIVPCEYSMSRQKELIDDIIDSHIMEYNPENLDDWRNNLHNFEEKFIQLAPTLKHPSFHQEKEWRIISGVTNYANSNVAFRPGKSMMVPYFEFELSEPNAPFDFHEVYVGPTPHQELARHSVIGLMYNSENTQTGLEFRNITQSKIPYRNW